MVHSQPDLQQPGQINTSNEEFLDALIRHQIGLLRVAKGTGRKVREVLDATETDIRRIIRRKLRGRDQEDGPRGTASGGHCRSGRPAPNRSHPMGDGQLGRRVVGRRGPVAMGPDPPLEIRGRDLVPVPDGDDREISVEAVEDPGLGDHQVTQRERFPGAVTVLAVARRADHRRGATTASPHVVLSQRLGLNPHMTEAVETPTCLARAGRCR